MATLHQGRRSHMGHPPPPAYPHGAGAVPGNLWPIFVRSMFSAKNSNLYYLIIIIAMITQMSRVLNSLLSIVRRQTDANLIILPWVLCLVPRVTTCRFYIDTAFQLVHVNKIRAVTGISISLRSKKFIYKVQITTLVQNYNVRSLYYCHAFKTRKASKYFQF